MSVLATITVLLMLSVLTHLVILSVPVTRDTVEMELHVLVSIIIWSVMNWYLSLVDTNECFTGTDNCSLNAVCTNIPGSFTCACNQGYTGDGVSCVGKYQYRDIMTIFVNLHRY